MYTDKSIFALVRLLNLSVSGDFLQPAFECSITDFKFTKEFVGHWPLEDIILAHCQPFFLKSDKHKETPLRTVAYRVLSSEEFNNGTWEPQHPENTFILGNSNGKVAEKLSEPVLAKHFNTGLNLGDKEPFISFKSGVNIHAMGFGEIQVFDDIYHPFQIPLYSYQTCVDRLNKRLHSITGPQGDILKFQEGVDCPKTRPYSLQTPKVSGLQII